MYIKHKSLKAYLTRKKSLLSALLLLALIVFELVAVVDNPSFKEQSASPRIFPANLYSLPIAKQEAFWAQQLKKSNLEETYNNFKTVYAQLSSSKQHTFAHMFGELLYDTVGVEGISACDSSFAFGCYHGFFGKAIYKEGLDILPPLDHGCIKKYGLKGLGCPHGIGHGVLPFVGYDKLNEALQACAALSWKEPIGGCTSGVFMEYNFPTEHASGNTQTRTYDGTNPHWPCIGVPKKFLQACYFEQPMWWERAFNQNYATIGKLCNDLDQRLVREACFRGLGNSIGPTTNYDVAESIKRCQAMPDISGQTLCRAGASWSFYADPTYRHLSQLLCADLHEMLQYCVQKADLYDDIDEVSR